MKKSNFDPYKENQDKRLFERGKEIKSIKEMFDRKREEINRDPRKKIFVSQKGGQERKKMSGKHKVSLPTVNFLKDKDP